MTGQDPARATAMILEAPARVNAIHMNERGQGCGRQRQPVLVSLNLWQVVFGLQHPRM